MNRGYGIFLTKLSKTEMRIMEESFLGKLDKEDSLKFIKCEKCNMSWYVKKILETRVHICPDCGAPIRKKKNLLMEDSLKESMLHSKTVLGSKNLRKDIVEIVFKNSLKDKKQESWDVSADGSGEVQAWIIDKVLYIAADGDINATCCKSLFENYSNLTKIIFNNCFNTSNVLDMAYMFSGCSQLKELDLCEFDTKQTIDMSSMFSGCSKLKSLNMKSFDTSQVTKMRYMFANCFQLKQLDVSRFDFSKVKDQSHMFLGCYAKIIK